MKKIVAIISIILCVVGCGFICDINTANASEISNTVSGAVENVVGNETTGKLVEIKDKELKTIDDYKDAYGSYTYGVTAYVLNKVRIFSIPIAFIAIALSAIFQYVIGIKKLDVRDKGFALMIASITLLVICQVLPLVFAIVVKGWRG